MLKVVPNQVSPDDPLKNPTGSLRYCNSPVGGWVVNKRQVDAAIWLFSEKRRPIAIQILESVRQIRIKISQMFFYILKIYHNRGE